MAFELLLAPRRDNQISHLWRQEPSQPSHAFDFGNLIGDPLFELLVEIEDFLSSFAQFTQQSRVLDGDDCLGGEVLQQFNLFLGKWPCYLTVDSNDTN